MYVDITVLCFICINFREKNAGQKSIWKTEKNRIYNQKSDYCFGENFFFFVFCDAHFKDCLHYKMVTSQNLLSAAQVKDFFYFVEKLCSVLKMFKFL